MQDKVLVMKAVDLVAAYIAHNPLTQAELPKLLKEVLDVLQGHQPAARPGPPVDIANSYTDDHIICLEDGKPVVLLKRYLQTHHGMTPEQYREKWGLPDDYPFIAASYSRRRSEIAKEQGLGVR